MDSPCGSDVSVPRSTLGASDYSYTGQDDVHRNDGRKGRSETGPSGIASDSRSRSSAARVRINQTDTVSSTVDVAP